MVLGYQELLLLEFMLGLFVLLTIFPSCGFVPCGASCLVIIVKQNNG